MSARASYYALCARWIAEYVEPWSITPRLLRLLAADLRRGVAGVRGQEAADLLAEWTATAGTRASEEEATSCRRDWGEDWGPSTLGPLWPPRMFTSRLEAVRFVVGRCREVGGEHDWNITTQHCCRCGVSAVMLEMLEESEGRRRVGRA